MEKHYFDWPVRVYYEDTDCARVVYYANYFKFMERARTEWLRALGWSQERLYSELGVVFVVAEAKAKYKKPARLDDELVVRSTVTACARTSFEFHQEILRGDEVLTVGRRSLRNARRTHLPPGRHARAYFRRTQKTFKPLIIR